MERAPDNQSAKEIVARASAHIQKREALHTAHNTFRTVRRCTQCHQRYVYVRASYAGNVRKLRAFTTHTLRVLVGKGNPELHRNVRFKRCNSSQNLQLDAKVHAKKN